MVRQHDNRSSERVHFAVFNAGTTNLASVSPDGAEKHAAGCLCIDDWKPGGCERAAQAIMFT